jgi:hypothetical protein
MKCLLNSQYGKESALFQAKSLKTGGPLRSDEVGFEGLAM